MFAAFGFGGGGSTFSATYRVYPVSFLEKESAERGDKLILPPSALDRLASLHIEYPMLFRAENRSSGRSTHCGVLEFVADEGACYMPWWMMQNLALGEGDLVSISSASLPKGTFVKLRPHTSDFLDISNPRAVLETTLRGYSCLTVGDAVCLHYNAKRYYIDVVEARPADAVSVIETDCEVDFAPPLDYVEPVYPSRGGAGAGGEAGGGEAGPSTAAGAGAGAAAAGMAPSISGAAAAGAAPAAAAAAAAEAEKQEPAFVPFVGSGRRLDGKPATTTTAPSPSSSSAPLPTSAPVAVPSRPSAAGAGAGAGASGSVGGGSSASGSARAQGTVVFGGGNRLLAKQQQQEKTPGGAAAAKPAAPPAEDKKDSAPAFEAFKGKGRSLRD